MEGERLGGSIYHVSDLNVYLGRQRVDPNGRKDFIHTFFVLNNKQLVFCFLNILQCLDTELQSRPQDHSFSCGE